MNESHSDEGEEPKICTHCAFRNHGCVIRERLEFNAERCSFFSNHVPTKPSQCTVSWPTGHGQRRWVIHYPNGSSITGTTEEDR